MKVPERRSIPLKKLKEFPRNSWRVKPKMVISGDAAAISVQSVFWGIGFPRVSLGLLKKMVKALMVITQKKSKPSMKTIRQTQAMFSFSFRKYRDSASGMKTMVGVKARILIARCQDSWRSSCSFILPPNAVSLGA